MTNSQMNAAAARYWIDPETPVRKPRTSDWTKLGDAIPTKDPIREERAPADIETSAMLVLSGEYEVIADVEEGTPLTKHELAAARPPRLAPKVVAIAALALASGGLLAHRYVPSFDAKVHSLTASMKRDLGPAPAPTTPVTTPVATTTTNAATVAAAPPVSPPTVTSSATLTLVPKMRAPSPPRSIAKTAANEHVQAKAKKKPTPTAKNKRAH